MDAADYKRALDAVAGNLTPLQWDLIAALCSAPGNALSSGELARLLGLEHHGAVNLAVVRLAKSLTRAVGAEPPKRRDGSARWWAVVADGHQSEDGRRFIWVLRPEVRDAALASSHFPAGPPMFAGDIELPLVEGDVTRILTNRYERNPVARRRCIAHYGCACVVCGFDFERAYGEAGRGIVHVHHLTPVSLADAEHEIDPVADLRPVCPNCHVMIHLRNPPHAIEELQVLIRNTRSTR